jgi:tetratricopeptide (TPR) repeat protein
MPPNLDRVEIAPMAVETQQQWFGKWAKLAGSKKTQQFQAFLHNQQCPEQVKTLAKEPLLLYLLANLHRDGKLQESQLTGDDPVAVRIQIYEAALDWVLTRQRSDNGADLNPKITGLDPGDLRTILAEAGLCVVQSGGESAAIALIEERLKDDEGAKQLLAQAKQNADQHPLKNALAAFYLKSTEGSKNQIEFFHKSFGEFLCAERLVESLVRWTKKEESRAKRYLVSEQTLDWEIYDLFGFGALTSEIVEYLIGLLKKAEPDWGELFKRLERFYLDWCDGTFIDATAETLPQRKARQLQNHQVTVGQRQVDIFTGCNVLILLLEIHRYAQSVESLEAVINFYPCGQPDTDRHDDKRLLCMINYSDCLQLGTFNQSVGQFFSSANLSTVYLSSSVLVGSDLCSAVLNSANLESSDLSCADLSSANLSSANLSSAVLHSADLIHADLSRAILVNADLRGADLRGADLGGANLRIANLSSAELVGADLVGADLRGAYLSSADLSNANLNKILWDGGTCWAGAQGLYAALNVPESLAQTPRFKAAVVLSQGIDWVLQGNVLEAIQAYREAQTIDTGLEIDSDVWDLLCWAGVLYNQAEEIRYVSDKATHSNSDWPIYFDTRGLVKALTGDLQGAIEDFESVLRTMDDNTIYKSAYKTLGLAGDRQQRQEWLEALRLEQNPFTPEELEELRREAEVNWIRWYRTAEEAVDENG